MFNNSLLPICFKKAHRSHFISTLRKSQTYIQRPGDGNKKIITLLPGDGIGPELCNTVKRVFKVANVPILFEEFPTNKCMNSDGTPSQIILDSLKKNKVGLKGNFLSKVGDNGFMSLNLQIRQKLELFALILRIGHILPKKIGLHNSIDLTIIRENLEGEYSGFEHEVTTGVVESLKLVSKKRCNMIAEYAFEYAFLNDRKTVHAVHKANIMKKGDGLFLDCVRNVAKKYPKIKYKEIIVDNCAMQMVTDPNQFDVMVMPNLYGSIISNIASGLMGGPGLVPGANVGTDIVLFEQGIRHVAADIAGKNLANPTAFILSAIMMLRHLSFHSFADKIEYALTQVLSNEKNLTCDIGGKLSTRDFEEILVDRLEKISNM